MRTTGDPAFDAIIITPTKYPPNNSGTSKLLRFKIPQIPQCPPPVSIITMSLEDLPHQSTQKRTESQQHQPQPCLQFPTREFLSTNVNKSVIQRRNRTLGLTKIWVNKEQLIEMIMGNTPTADENNYTRPGTHPHEAPQLQYDDTNTIPDPIPSTRPPTSTLVSTPPASSQDDATPASLHTAGPP
ncbi:hypothetical protein Pcinc_003674 [Petrolisthes cinctipes]|uniref:Uncharacterized protein n=1 Tax=Petrolisthes cinctipes TaxID=88211 RepID=A0AAE1GIJ0_PETCI|nr:hypothetical protein Pcinc_003674 [Petrolisthes cinctipes]